MKIYVMVWLLSVLLPGTIAIAQDQDQSEASLEKTVGDMKVLTAKEPDNAEAWFTLGRAYHDLANSYSVDCARESVKSLEKSDAIKPSAVTRAYLGSAWTLIARDSKNPLEKLDGVQKGCDLMDKAVAADPTNVVIRRIRYENNFVLPDIFERKNVAENDIDYLIGVLSKTPQAFDGLYDPAHVLLYKAKLLMYENDWRNAKKYALVAKKIVKDKAVAESIELFLSGKE
ncbi:MAG: hypothetical protein JXD23_10575 [Spirochaetales bacterium]|nr:hypothetical protein [Spirochaetales bacterium]